MLKRLLNHPFFIRLLHWEYWPFHVVYAPVYLYWLWLCARSRSFFFFNTANPRIRNGGFLMESKWEIYRQIPNEFYPSTLFFKGGTNADEVILAVKQAGISFPLIGKPDIGMQGIAVQKLADESELRKYVASTVVDFLIQSFVPYEHEAGIFYYRYPGEDRGVISGIVGKEFLAVTGDGHSTIEALLKKDRRFILQLETLRKTYGSQLHRILPTGEKFILVPYGNHVRGAKFLDISHLVSPELSASIDSACQQIPDFYYGRLDIRYQTWDQLCEGKNFSIIELNGAGSEPTHMYDPRHSLFFAWKEIVRHWNILWKISRINHQRNQQPYMTTRSGLSMLKENKRYLKLITPNYQKPG